MFTANAGFDTKIGSAGFPRYLEWPPFDFYAELSGGTSRLRHAIVMTTKTSFSSDHYAATSQFGVKDLMVDP